MTNNLGEKHKSRLPPKYTKNIPNFSHIPNQKFIY